GRLALVPAPQAFFKGQRAGGQAGSRQRRTQPSRSGRTEQPRHQLSGTEPAAISQNAAAGPDTRLSVSSGASPAHLAAPAQSPTVAAAPPLRCRRLPPRPWLTRFRAACAASNSAALR